MQVGVVEMGEDFEDVEFGEGGFGSGDAIDAVGGVLGAPGLDEAAEGVVGGQVGVEREGLFGDRAGGVVVAEEPVLDAVPVVGYSGYGRYGVFHNLEGYGTYEKLRDFNFSFVHCGGGMEWKRRW